MQTSFFTAASAVPASGRLFNHSRSNAAADHLSCSTALLNLPPSINMCLRPITRTARQTTTPRGAVAPLLKPRHICCSSPVWNPQNVQNPQVVPSLDLTPLEAVTAQLQAISRNDEPWANHGVQTMYEFAADAGSMERSRYFGFSKDLYHFDHFLHFKVACAALVDCQSYEVLSEPPGAAADRQQQLESGTEVFYASVVDSTGQDGGVFELRMVQMDFGLKKGCWMTKSCIKVS